MKRSENWFAVSTMLVVWLIFWSIWFISLQWYSSDARNSKRTSDLWSLQSALSTQLAQWQSILSFVDERGGKDNKIDSSVLSIWWRKDTSETDYSAWSVNYAALPVKQEDFQDPIWNSYVIWVTNRVNWRYQLGATIELWSAGSVAKVVWNYTERILKDAPCSKLVGDDKVITITVNFINYFQVWDYVNVKTDSWIIKTKINKISVDWVKLFLNNILNNPTSISLREAESIWLIDQIDADWKSWTNFVVDWWYNLPY